MFRVIDLEEPSQSPGAAKARRAPFTPSASALADDGSGHSAQHDLLTEAAGHWRKGPAAPGPQPPAPFSADAAVAQVPLRLQDRTRSVLSQLGNVLHDRGEAMAAICALMLAGATPSDAPLRSA